MLSTWAANEAVFQDYIIEWTSNSLVGPLTGVEKKRRYDRKGVIHIDDWILLNRQGRIGVDEGV